MKKIAIPTIRIIIPLKPIIGKIGFMVNKTYSNPSIGRIIGGSLGILRSIFAYIVIREKLAIIRQAPIIKIM